MTILNRLTRWTAAHPWRFVALVIVALALAAIVPRLPWVRSTAQHVAGTAPVPGSPITDPQALAWAEAIGAAWPARDYATAEYRAAVYAVADLADAVSAGATMSPAARLALAEAINTMERTHGTDAAIVPWIRLGRAVLERSER